MSSKEGYSCFVTTSKTLIWRSKGESEGFSRAFAPALRREVNIVPYVPYLVRMLSIGVSHSRIAIRRGREGILIGVEG